MNFPKWKLTAVQDMSARFGIQLEEFYDDQELEGYMEGDTPEEFVSWFAEKHNLEPITPPEANAFPTWLY